MFAFSASSFPYSFSKDTSGKLALLGGNPVRSASFTGWPIWTHHDEDAVLPVLKSGRWSRARVVTQTEQKLAGKIGSKYCLLTTHGTTALITSVYALGAEGGDEVITTPYTFVATIHAIFLNNALPVFVDIDPETWQVDADLIEEAITPETKLILPVHIVSGLSHMDKINALSGKYGLKVVADACQVPFAEWRGDRSAIMGDLGCLSFQNSKQLTCGEGGAILGNDEEIMDICYSYHNFGRIRGKYMPRDKGAHPILASKCRMTEFQASIIMTQLDSIEQQTQTRSQNGEYLRSKLQEIPGIVPRKDYPETTMKSYYCFGFRFKEEVFGFSRDTFMKALRAEGIPVGWGLGVIEGKSQHQEGVVESVISSKTFRKLYSKERLDRYRDSLHLPEAEKLVREVAGFPQSTLLGSKSDMDDIYNAVLKIYENRQDLKE